MAQQLKDHARQEQLDRVVETSGIADTISALIYIMQHMNTGSEEQEFNLRIALQHLGTAQKLTADVNL